MSSLMLYAKTFKTLMQCARATRGRSMMTDNQLASDLIPQKPYSSLPPLCVLMETFALTTTTTTRPREMAGGWFRQASGSKALRRCAALAAGRHLSPCFFSLLSLVAARPISQPQDPAG